MTRTQTAHTPTAGTVLAMLLVLGVPAGLVGTQTPERQTPHPPFRGDAQSLVDSCAGRRTMTGGTRVTEAADRRAVVMECQRAIVAVVDTVTTLVSDGSLHRLWVLPPSIDTIGELADVIIAWIRSPAGRLARAERWAYPTVVIVALIDIYPVPTPPTTQQPQETPSQ